MKKIILGILFIGGLISCNHEPTKEEALILAREKITELEKQTFEDIKIDLNLASTLVSMYQTYADNNPSDSLTPEYLFKSGEVQMGLKKYENAIATFSRIKKHYKEYNKVGESIYMIGFIYDEYLDKKGKAKQYYEELINTYPNHDFADDAQASIEMLHMSNEELIKMFEEKAKQKELNSEAL